MVLQKFLSVIKTKSLKYEEHGDWQGTYLRKALNIIEAGFLFGWNKEEYYKHLAERPKLTNLEKVMRIITEEAPRPVLVSS